MSPEFPGRFECCEVRGPREPRAAICSRRAPLGSIILQLPWCILGCVDQSSGDMKQKCLQSRPHTPHLPGRVSQGTCIPDTARPMSKSLVHWGLCPAHHRQCPWLVREDQTRRAVGRPVRSQARDLPLADQTAALRRRAGLCTIPVSCAILESTQSLRCHSSIH